MSSRAELVFESLVGELADGRADPETLFAAHPDVERELWDLYRGWRRVDSLFRELAAGSAVRSALGELGPDTGAAEQARILERIERARPFAERYELGEELGRGGMGIVRRVRDRLLGQELALKVVRERGGDAERLRLLRRFLAEAELTGRLQHPSIPAIHDLGLDDAGRVYFTMPRIEGETLERVLERSREGDARWTQARVLEVLVKVGDALAYAHSRGVLHRDLKPANVLVGAFGEAYVLDWGLARALDGRPPSGRGPALAAHAPSEHDAEHATMTLSGEVVGTPAYMAPEQASGAEPDERCDVYSLGAVLYEALAGHRPYSTRALERGALETLARLASGGPEPIDAVAPAAPARLRAIVRKAMQREPAARYRGAADFCADLRAFLDGRVVSAYESGRWAEARAWVARNRGLAAAVAFAAVATVGGGGLSLALHARNARLERDARSATRASARASLVRALGKLHHTDRIVGASLVRPSDPGIDAHSASASGTLRRYMDAFSDARIGVLATDLAALYSDASDRERDTLLDELLWYRLRVVAEGSTLAPASLSQILHDLDRIVGEWEHREWPRALLHAWNVHRGGDPGAFGALTEEARLARASAADLEMLAMFLMSIGDHEKARDVLLRTAALDRGRFGVHFHLARMTSGRERLEHAHAATVLDPTSAPALYNYAWNFQFIDSPPFGDDAVAAESYRAALALDPDLWEAALNLTYLVEPDEAIALMEAALARTPSAILYLRLAERWRAAGDAARAVVVCEEAVARYPDDASLWGLLGECYVWTARWQESADALERAIQLDPRDATAHNNLCVALASLSLAEADPARAAELDRRNLEVAEAAYALAPERADVVEKLGIAHCNLGDLASGARHLLRSRELGNANTGSFLTALRAELARSPEHAALVGEIDAALGP